MKKGISLLLALTMVVTSLSIAFPVFANTGAEDETVVDELSELYRDEAEDDKSIEDSAASRVIVKANIKPETYGDAEMIKGTDDIYIYQYETAEDAASALEYYDSLNYVKWAETDGIMEGQSLSYGNQMVGGDEAKTYVSTHNVELNDVNVALVDSGVLFSNSMFDGRVTDSGVNLSESGTEGTALDANGHGSHIASIIVDNTPDNVHVTAYKVLNQNNVGTHLGIATGIDKAVEDGADIISLSIYSSDKSELIIDAVKNAYANGVIIVNCAGNDSDDVANYYPANMDEVFTVGAIDEFGCRAFYSNFGEEIDFVAPGHKVEYTGFYEPVDEGEVGYGTSYAVPYVVAAAAMVLSVDADLGIEEVKQRLIDSCIPMESLKYHDGFHEIEEYVVDLNWPIMKSDPETDEECYGYGMPQILKAMQITEKNSPVEFSVQSGSYHESFELTLTANEGSDIYYTTEEVYPSPENSTLYTGPIEVSETMSVRAIAVSNDKSKSEPVACKYFMSYYADEDDFEIDDRGYITKYTGDLREMVVPETIDGITVKGVAKYAFSNPVRTIVFPDTVEELEDYSLFSALSLEFLIGHGIKRIGESISYGNILLIDTPSVVYIGAAAFYYHGRELYFPELREAGECAFTASTNLVEVYLPKLEKVSWAMFQDCYTLRTVRLDSVETIDNDAFANCYRLKNIYAPNLRHLTTSFMNYGTFHRCFNLTEVSFPFVEEIPKNCFNYCLYLEKADLPSVVQIANLAFNYCQRLKDINFPKLKEIDYRGFFSTALSDVNLPSLVTIGKDAFCNSTISSLYAPNLEKIENTAFSSFSEMYGEYSQNTNLKTLYAPKLTTLSDEALAYTSGLTELELPSLKTIGENAFYESGVNYLYAPELETAESLPVAENSSVVLSSKFSECNLDSTGYDLTVYGTPNTFAETYANNNKLKFVALPILINEPPMEYTDKDTDLAVEVLGFNKTYQWYGAYEEDNTSGTAIEEATEPNFNPADFKAYPYYYCVITSSDGDYQKIITTGTSKDMVTPADYTEYESAVDNAEKLIESGLYKDTAALEAAVDIDISGKTIAEQQVVDYQTQLIQSAIDALEFKTADYSKLDELIETIPSDLSMYTEESVNALNTVVNSIDRTLLITEQEAVDEYVEELNSALQNLKYKSADLSKLNDAIASVPDDLTNYTDESIKAIEELLKKLESYKNADITLQAEIDALTEQIYAAIENLAVKDTESSPGTDSNNPNENITKEQSSVNETEANTQNKNVDNSLKSPLTGSNGADTTVLAAFIAIFAFALVKKVKKNRK